MAEAVAGVERGAGALFQLTGEPGVGKSRLVEELQRMAGDLVVMSRRRASPTSRPRRTTRSACCCEVCSGSQRRQPSRTPWRSCRARSAFAPALAPWIPLLGTCSTSRSPRPPRRPSSRSSFAGRGWPSAMADLLGAMVGGPLLLDRRGRPLDGRGLSRHPAPRGGRGRHRPWLVCVTPDVHERRDSGRPRTGSGAGRPRTPRRSDAAGASSTWPPRTHPFPPTPSPTLAERSGGNPLFLRELVVSAAQGAGTSRRFPTRSRP